MKQAEIGKVRVAGFDEPEEGKEEEVHMNTDRKESWTLFDVVHIVTILL